MSAAAVGGSPREVGGSAGEVGGSAGEVGGSAGEVGHSPQDGRASVDLRLALPALAAWLGCFVGLAADVRWVASGAAAAVSAAMLAWRFRLAAATAVLLCLATGLGVAGLRVAALHAGPVPELGRAHSVVTATLVLTADARRVTAATHGIDRGRALIVVPARLELIVARGRQVRIRSPVLVLADHGRWSGLLPGQRVVTAGRLGPARPGQPVSAVLSVHGAGRLLGRPSLVQRAAGDLRAGLRRAVADLPRDERGLVPGLVVGDTTAMPPELEDDFRTAGLTHLNAVSGANLAIVCGFVLYVGRWAGLRGRWLPAVGLGALVGFVVLARPQPSVLRAGVMGLVALVALGTGRRRGGLAALAAAMLGLLLVDPWLARSYGFVLSVLATAGLLLLAPGWADALHARGVPMPLAQALAVPAAAQTVCAPVIAMLSGQISLVAVPANLLVAPAVAPATILGVLATLSSALADGLARPIAHLAGWPAWWIVTVARRSAGVSFASTGWTASPSGAAGLAVGTVVAVVVGRRVAARARYLAAAAVIFLAAAFAVSLRPAWPPPGWLLVACDVGQGDALVLAAGSGGAVVVDAGPDPRAVDGCLRDLGVRRVSVVVLTHLHADHVEGLPGVLHGRRVGQVLLGPYDEPAGELRRVRGWTAAADVPVQRVVVGERDAVGSLTFQVLWPARVIEDGSVPNNASIVMVVELAGVRMMLTGDIEVAAQRALLARWHAGPMDVLKVAHHGSANQSPDLLDALRPRLALISVGVGNDYGHPATSTLRRLTGLGAVVGRTDRDGDLAVVGSVEGLRLVTRR